MHCSNRWTYRVFIINTHHDRIAEPDHCEVALRAEGDGDREGEGEGEEEGEGKERETEREMENETETWKQSPDRPRGVSPYGGRRLFRQKRNLTNFVRFRSGKCVN